MEGEYLDILASRGACLIFGGVVVGERKSGKLVVATGRKLIGRDCKTITTVIITAINSSLPAASKSTALHWSLRPHANYFPAEFSPLCNGIYPLYTTLVTLASPQGYTFTMVNFPVVGIREADHESVWCLQYLPFFLGVQGSCIGNIVLAGKNRGSAPGTQLK